MKMIQLAMTGFGIENQVIRANTQKKQKDFSKRKLVARVLQLGAGRQSSAIAEMIVEGDLPPVDLVIFADTGDEPPWVYGQVWYLAGRLASVGISLQIVRSKNEHGLVETAMIGGRFASMPIYTGTHGKKMGMLRRQCSNEYKVIPATDYTRQWLLERGHAFRRRDGARVVKTNIYIDQIYGMGTDERYRAQKERGPGWQKSCYPLIELGMTTDDCLDYLKKKGLPIPNKSACRVCPYHDDPYWLMVETYYPPVFEYACFFDDWLRSPAAALSKSIGGIRQQCYLHDSCIPLREVDFKTRIEERGRRKVSKFQLELFGAELETQRCGTDGGFTCFS